MHRSDFDHILKEGNIFKITPPQVKTGNISTPVTPCQCHSYISCHTYCSRHNFHTVSSVDKSLQYNTLQFIQLIIIVMTNHSIQFQPAHIIITLYNNAIYI